MKIYIPTILVVLLDQFSKMWIVQNYALWESREIIGSFIKFSFVRNTGIAFGISVGSWIMFVVILSLFATMFIGYLHWKERHNHPLLIIGLGMIFGGAIGNLIDRCAIFFTDNYKGVIDFIDVGIGVNRWYTFNVADSAVTIGIILFMFHSLIEKNILINNNE